MVRQPPPDGTRPASLAQLGALLGDPVRAAIVTYLSDGSRRPAGELASLAGASQQAASAHLKLLVEGGLIRAERQGRHRFFQLASGDVAEALEHLVTWIDEPRRMLRRNPCLCQARLCYDHLAGRLGVALFDRMSALDFFKVGPDGPDLSLAGAEWYRSIGVDVPTGVKGRPLIRMCLDWTERRPHLGGRLGALLADYMREAGFIISGPLRRSILITAKGSVFMRTQLDLHL